MPTPEVSSAKITADQNRRPRRGRCRGGAEEGVWGGAARGGAMRGPLGELRKEACCCERSSSDKLHLPSKPRAGVLFCTASIRKYSGSETGTCASTSARP